MNSTKKILIIKLSAIGDIAQSTPILHALRRKFPNDYIAWAVEDKNAEIIENNPLINEVFLIPKLRLKNLKQYLSIINIIRTKKFDIVIDLQELFKSALIVGLSGAKRRIAHAKTREFAHVFINEKLPAHDNFDPDKRLLERYLEPAAYLGAPINEINFSLPPVLPETKIYVDKLLENIDKTKESVVFCPATIWKSKHWPEEYWAVLLKKLSHDYNIIFIGTEKDKQLIDRIAHKAQTEKYLSLAGKTNLSQLVEIYNRTQYLIAPDTGPAHISNALQNVKIIMLFGSTGVKRTPPYGEKHKALAVNLPCQPCFNRICPKKDNYMDCVKQLTPEMVLEALSELKK